MSDRWLPWAFHFYRWTPFFHTHFREKGDPHGIKRNGKKAALSSGGRLSNAECMDLVKDIQKNYRLPYPARTIGEKIAEARQQSGAEKLKGHDIMALERFDPEVKHMNVFDVLSYDSPVGDKGDKMRLFLTDAGYQKFLESQERGEVKLKNHAKVSDGHLHYDRRDHAL